MYMQRPSKKGAAANKAGCYEQRWQPCASAAHCAIQKRMLCFRAEASLNRPDLADLIQGVLEA